MARLTADRPDVARQWTDVAERLERDETWMEAVHRRYRELLYRACPADAREAELRRCKAMGSQICDCENWLRCTTYHYAPLERTHPDLLEGHVIAFLLDPNGHRTKEAEFEALVRSWKASLSAPATGGLELMDTKPNEEMSG